MRTEDFDFVVPDELIAFTPVPDRSDSRLLVYDRSTDSVQNSFTRDLTDHIDSGFFPVFNNSKVIPARLQVKKASTGTNGEFLIVRIIDDYNALVITDSSKKYKKNTESLLPGGEVVRVIETLEDGIKMIHSDNPVFNIEYLNRYGQIPLPPYIDKKPDETDKYRYQTIYGKEYGSSAAPTAGLHFDKRLFDSMAENGIDYGFVSLHVGLGTFQPIYTDLITDHRIHSERYQIDEENADKINNAIKYGKKILPIGTTSLRTLETAYNNGIITAGEGESSIYIYPSYDFKVTSALFTNFHTPKSSLAVLVSAMIGLDKLKELYSYAVEQKYRFFSYGDAMLIL